MKHLLIILSVLLTISFVSCDPKENIPDKGKLDPSKMILIKPAKGVQLRSNVSGLTALEIVEKTMGMTFQSKWFSNNYYEDTKILDRGFGDNQRDFNTPALMMFGTDIITSEGIFMKEFIYGTDFYLINNNLDTIGYIPQSVINNARVLIEGAFADKNYNEVYRLFNEAFTFLPITGDN